MQFLNGIVHHGRARNVTDLLQIKLRKKTNYHKSAKGPQYDSTYLRGRRKHEKKIIESAPVKQKKKFNPSTIVPTYGAGRAGERAPVR
jgi:hypothetical protein